MSKQERRAFFRKHVRKQRDQIRALAEARIGIPAAKNADELLRDQFHMEIMRSVLTHGEFVPILNKLNQFLGLEVERLESMRSLARVFLRLADNTGSRNFKLIYNLGSMAKLETEAANGILDLCFDWAIASGCTMEMIIENIDFPYERGTFRPIPIPKRLAQLLSKTPISDFEPRAHVVEGSLSIPRGVGFERRTYVGIGEAGEPTRTYVGPLVVVSVDKDRLAPIFLYDTNAMGRYAHTVMVGDRIALYTGHALDYVEKLNRLKKRDVRNDDIRNAFYRVLGIMVIQTAFILEALVLDLLFDGDVQESSTSGATSVQGSASYSWLVLELRGHLESLTAIFKRRDLPLYKKIAVLSFIADLPMCPLLACLAGPQYDTVCNTLRQSIVELLDRLTDRDLGLITDRKRGDPSSGKLNENPPPKGQKILHGLSKIYPSLDWKRRWESVDEFLGLLQDAKFQPTWDSRSRPPRLWIKWANSVLKKST